MSTWAPPPETSADSSRRRLKDATELGDVFELPDAVAAALFHRILAVNSSSSGDDDTSTGDDDVAASTHAEISLADCVVYLAVCKTKPGAALEEADALFRRGCTLADLAKVAMDDDDDEDERAGPVLGDVIETPRPIRDETNKKVSGARRGRPNPSPPVHPRAPRARPVRSQRRRSLSHPHARGCVAVGRDVTTRAPTRVDASVLQRRRRRKILRHLLRSGHRVERAYAGVRQDTRRVCSRRVRLGG